jgi:glucose/arabinose dehydrogenase
VTLFTLDAARHPRAGRDGTADLNLGFIAIAAALMASFVSPASASAVGYPAGFEEEIVVSGLTRPTAVDWTPDGRMFVAEKDGVLKVVPAGGSSATTVLDLRSRVNSWWDRGLLGLAVDSSFATNGYVYLLYTYDVTPLVRDSDSHTVSQLLRVKLGPAGEVEQETPILGTHVSAPCPAPANELDCIPSEGWSHSIGTVRSAPDGTLWVGSGDAADYNVPDDLIFRTLDERSMAGKILHVDRNGRALPEHGFCPGDQDLDHVCAKVHALGLRNPYRFSLRAGTGLPAVGDVGQNEWEEIDLLGPPGGRYGWPCYEGAGRTAAYEAHARCAAEYVREGTSSAHLPPAIQYAHSSSPASDEAAVVMGPTYTGGEYPLAYRDSLFYGDYVKGFIRRATFDSAGQSTVHEFASDWSGIDLEQSPAGHLVYVDFASGHDGLGSVKRIAYSPGNARPAAVAEVLPTSGSPPLDVSFDGRGSSDPEGAPLSYRWDFGDGSAPATTETATHTYALAGAYTAVLTVIDPGGKTDSESVRIDVGNSPPEPAIYAPATFRGGEPIALHGAAGDADEGSLGPEALAWNVTLVHGTHTHVAGSFTGLADISVPAQDDHDADSHFLVSLMATDAEGLSATATARIDPETALLRIASDPPGAPVAYGGSLFSAPLERTAAIGFRTLVSAGESFVRDGTRYEFAGWADGAPRLRSIVIPPEGIALTATYSAASGGTVPAGGGTDPAGEATDPAGGGTDATAWDTNAPGAAGEERPAADRTGPAIAFDPARGFDRRRGLLTGSARDPAGVSSVQVALGRRLGAGRCRWWLARRARLARTARPCAKPRWLRVHLTQAESSAHRYRWRAPLGRRSLPTSAYRVWITAADRLGNASRQAVPIERLDVRSQFRLRSSSFLPITIRWISDVPSPIRSSGASR